MDHLREETKNETVEPLLELDLGIFFHDIMRGALKFWWLVVALVVLGAAAGFVSSTGSYRPMYRAEATFTVETDNNDAGYSFYYDNRTAAQMARTFPYLLDSDLLLDRVKADMGVEVLNGVPGAKVIENSNLFTLTVTSADPQAAYDILLALIDNYPAVSEYVIGKTRLNMIGLPQVPEKPYNSANRTTAMLKGVLVGGILAACMLAIYAVSRGTVRKEVDITGRLHTQCLGTVPMVFRRRSGSQMTKRLSIRGEHVGAPFRESIRGTALHVHRKMDGKKVLAVTGAVRGEGVSTMAENLACALADQGKQVLLINTDLQHCDTLQTGLESFLLEGGDLSGVLRQSSTKGVWEAGCSRSLTEAERNRAISRFRELIAGARQVMDYIILDAPALDDLDQATPALELAERILFVVRQDSCKISRIMNAMEDLGHFDGELLGCVLNGLESGLIGYGYSYGYGYGYGYGTYGQYGNYGRYGHYGRYGRYGNYGHYGYGYGYGEEKPKPEKKRNRQ